MGSVFFELAPWSSMMLCPQLEEARRSLHGWQLELLNQLRLVASYYEIFDCVGRKGWLHTTISLPPPGFEDCSLRDCIFVVGSVEHDMMKSITAHSKDTAKSSSCETYWRELEELHRNLVARVRIQSNVVPRNAYRQKGNKEVRRHQHGSNPPRAFRRECYLVDVVEGDAAVESVELASEKPTEWRSDGCQRVPVSRLQTLDSPQSVSRNGLLHVNPEDVTECTMIADEVWTVIWRNGIYVRKSFFEDEGLQKELDAALRVFHPHVLRPVRQTLDPDRKPCLLMEKLESDLYRVFIELDFIAHSGHCPVVGSVESSIEVLLQVARGLKALHQAHVVHGDIKPQNIFLSHFKVPEREPHHLVKIADFDVSQVFDSPENFEPSFGTTNYAAPEVLKRTRSSHNLGGEAFCAPANFDGDPGLPYKLDVYSFGCVAYEVLTGEPVYGGNILDQLSRSRVVDGTLTPDGSIETAAEDAPTKEQTKCPVWHNRIKKIYPVDLISCLERCWELEPTKRPSAIELCRVLKRSKADILRQASWKKRRNAFVWNVLVLCLLVFICCFVGRYVDAEEVWSALERLAVNVAALALVGVVCVCCLNHSRRAQGLGKPKIE